MRKLFSARCWILVLLSLYVTVAHAQDSVPTHPVDGTFIKEWLVLGPFFPEDLETDFLASTNGEALANPKPGDTVTTADGKTLTWKVYRTERKMVNLLHAVGNHREAVCYAFCLLESDEDGAGEILVGSDDGVVIFLNGQRVHTQPVRRSVVVDKDKVAVSLRRGKNRCLMKVSNGFQNWVLTTRVLPPTRAVIAGVIANEAGKTLSNAIVHLWQGRTLIAKTETDSKGNYQFSVYPASGHYDIQASHGDRGNWTRGVQLSTGVRVNMNLTLQKAISISGYLLTLDNTPHVGVLVEALSLDESGPRQRRVTTFSDKAGRYKFINLEPGSYQLRCHTWDAQSSNPNIIVSVTAQETEYITFHFPPFKRGTWKNHTYLDGLGDNYIESIYQDRAGFLWFGTSNAGVSRYDGDKFVNFTMDDGFASNTVPAIHEDKAGHLWFGSRGGDGASRYDGENFVNFTTDDGLTQNDVTSIYQDRDGFLWFGTLSGGVSRYDGTSWITLDTRDGLIDNRVFGINQDSDGRLWFATLEGVTQYNPKRVSPSVRIISVQSHKTSVQTGALKTIKDITTDTRVTIKYSSIDFKTVKEKRQYRVRIKEIDADWRKPTLSDTFNISFNKPGTYTFEVVAIDRDLNYSAPARLTLTVVLPWYQNKWILYPLGGAIVVLMLFCGILAHRYYQQRQQVLAYQREAVSELADAREMQMGLIPQTAPEVPGFEIAGVCNSARTVSGDFFDYVPLSNGAIAVVLADVTGKGMKGAMNAVLSSGVLHSVAQLEVSPSQMLRALNQNLYPRFQRYTNCAMAILTIDPEDRTVKYANAGIPYPVIKRGEDDVEELSIDGTPLGAFQSSEYQETPPIELKSGDSIVLFSDGITEAPQRNNPDQFYMETDRLVHLIKGLDGTMTVTAMIDAIINDVRDFSGTAQQNDDMTIVIIKTL